MDQTGSVDQANTVSLFLTGSDGYDNTAGLILEPTLIFTTTLPV